MNEMPQLDQLIAAVREESTRQEYQVPEVHPMLPMSDIGMPAPRPPKRPVSEQVSTQKIFEHVDELLLISDNTMFVESAYKALLGRSADALGTQTYIEKLTQGYGQMFVLAALRASDEARRFNNKLAGFGLAPLVYNGWRLGRHIGLTAPARLMSNAYSAWRHLRLTASGRLTSQLSRTVIRLNLVENNQRRLKELTLQLEEAAQARGQIEERLVQQQLELGQAQKQMKEQLRQQQLELGQAQKQMKEQLRQQQLELGQAQKQMEEQLRQQQLELRQAQKQMEEQLRQQKIAKDLFEDQNKFELKLLRARLEVLQQRTLTNSVVSIVPVTASTTEIKVMSERLQTELDNYYMAFENTHRGSHLEIIEKMSPYLAKVAELEPELLVLPMVDIGCGRGEWLELLRAQGFDAMGLDLSTAMVQHCRSRGLRAEQVDAHQWLIKQPDNSLAVVSGFHVIEHLAFEQLFQLIGQVWRVLRPGGALILETPNPENVLVGSHTFYHDHSHRNPVTPTSLQFLLGYHGFTSQQVLRLNPCAAEDRLHEHGALAERVNGHLYGPQDYGIVTHKL